MKTYTLREAAKKIGVTARDLKQWEKQFAEWITIPRTSQGARIYTEELINQFRHIQTLLASGRRAHEIAAELKQANEPSAPPEAAVMEGEIIDVPRLLRHGAPYIAEQLAARMKDDIVTALKQETVAVVRQAMDEVKGKLDDIGEQTAAAAETVHRSLRDYKEAWQQKTEQLHEHLETVVAFCHEEKARQEEERKQLEQRILEREKAFRELVLSFRQTATSAVAARTRANKWWKFW
ncbi:MerR family transcriptional regulator [Geobacillus subterraneus]|uniref:MerR family transcriptional regulator n=1 Tax=Geobacillus subterraneus TaxID=129338 RepID=UPI001442C447|nr:MerR family transcriptional regulator [Geobacillus subterraneus]QIZ67796.1 MerR family transcriptional regulator [Geobacillus subterraneus]